MTTNTRQLYQPVPRVIMDYKINPKSNDMQCELLLSAEGSEPSIQRVTSVLMNTTTSLLEWYSNSATTEVRYPYPSIDLPTRVREFKTVMQLYLLAPFSLVGLVCNIMSITALKRDKSMIPTTSLLLQMLAVADLLSLLFLAPIVMTKVVGLPQRTQDLIDAFLSMVYLTWYTTAVWLGVMLTAERYIAVCYPLKITRIGTLPRVRTAGITIWFLAFAVNAWHPFQKHLVIDKNGNLQLTCWEMCDSAAYGLIYYGIIIPAFAFYVPLGLLIFFTTRVLIELGKAYKEKLELTSEKTDGKKRMSTKQRRATATLMSIVLVFIVLQIVNNVSCLLIVVNFMTDQSQVLLYQIFYAITSLLLAIQSTLNFFLYALTGQKYRQVLRDGLKCNECNFAFR